MSAKTNIVLIGMPGAGKSTAGVILAKTLGKSFVDTDLLLQQQEGRLLQASIEALGLEGFLAREEAAVLGLAAADSVIATGGSVVYSARAMAHLRETGIVLYLQAGLSELAVRLHDMQSRGIAMAKGKTLAELYAERVPLYLRHADHTIACDGKNVEQVVAVMAALLARR